MLTRRVILSLNNGGFMIKSNRWWKLHHKMRTLWKARGEVYFAYRRAKDLGDRKIALSNLLYYRQLRRRFEILKIKQQGPH